MEKKENTNPLVSIVIPVYNDAKYLKKCLDSILAQTVDYWEVWMTDDCSTDESKTIMEKYCEKDSRFHMFVNNSNSSAWVGRAKGILATSSSVKYILFADADDTLQTNMVERTYIMMEENPVDILHFGTNVENCSGVSRKQIQAYTRYLQPPVKSLRGKEIFDSFVERKFEGHLWNKMFNAQLLKNVINHIGSDKILPKAQDKVLYWAVCWFKENLTYRGVEERLYNYNYGLGVEGDKDRLTLEQYNQYLCQAWTEDTIASIMDEHPKDKEEYQDVLENSRYNLVKHSIKNYKRLANFDKATGLDKAASMWTESLDKARLVCALAEYTWNEQIELANILRNVEAFKTNKKGSNIKVIGTYYHRMDNGGIQRVIARIIEYWHRLNYKVVLFTDCDPTENDYVLPEYVERVKIARPQSKCKNTNYYERGMSFAKLIQKYQVDCMVYHSYFSDVLLYDTCICKGMDVPFILYEHNVFTKYIRYNDLKFATVPIMSKLADAIVCLDETDKQWWNCFNSNVHVVLNPLTFDLDKTRPAERNNQNILFLGRLVEEAKKPLDAISIAEKVISQYPNAKLFIVGTSEDKNYLKKLEDRINGSDYKNNIIMYGFNKDVEEYYLNASVFLSCSTHEGFMLTLCEAMSYNIPMVMYELPYLATTINNPGVISVQQDDIDAAADEICKLFENREHLLDLGDKGRKYLENMYQVDIGKQWENILSSINNTNVECNNSFTLLAETIVRDYLAGMFKQIRANDECKEEIDKYKNEISELEKRNRISEREKRELNNLLNQSKNSESLIVVNELQKALVNQYEISSNHTERFITLLEECKYKNDNLNKKNQDLNFVINETRKSFTYKIGRFITFIPRKLRSLFNGE